MKIVITESQLKSLIPEQLDMKDVTKWWNTQLSSCLPNAEVSAAVGLALKQKAKLKKLAGIKTDQTFLSLLKYAVATMGRESDYGTGDIGDKAALVVRNLWGGDMVMDALESVYGQGMSLGPAQFTKKSWLEYGLDDKVGDFDEIGNSFTSLAGTFYRIADDYKLGLKRGVGITPSINPIQVKKGTIKKIDGSGNVSMDLAIIAHNMGQNKIQKYCKTSDPNYNAPCDSPNGKYTPHKDKPAIEVYTDKWVPGYFPNLGFKELTSIGYLEEVIKRAKQFTCIT